MRLFIYAKIVYTISSSKIKFYIGLQSGIALSGYTIRQHKGPAEIPCEAFVSNDKTELAISG